jgi:SAM-dependent methyltransferase
MQSRRTDEPLALEPSRYDQIGLTYADYRRPDPRIAEAIERALGDAATVINVGSGAGSYEPRRPRVLAIEPSLTMIRQRARDAAPVIQAAAEHLPVRGGTFDAALAVLTVHHWYDPAVGLSELVRVSREQVVLTWDPTIFARFWLIDEYLPELAEAEAKLPTLAAVVSALNPIDVQPVLVPWDCTDGFCGAYWRRPERYLDPAARAAISAFAVCPRDAVERAVSELERDLQNGAWMRRHSDLLALSELDLGYRLVISRGRP